MAYIRKHRSWGAWFALFVLLDIASQLVFNGKTIAQANFFIFYSSHFIILLLFSTFCTDTHLNARIYLSIIAVLAFDVCLMIFISSSRILFNIDYIDFGTFPVRVLSHFILLGLKIGAAVIIKKQTRRQIYGIESVFQAVIIMLPAMPYFILRSYAFFVGVTAFSVPLFIYLIEVLCGICALVNMIVSESLSYQIRQNDLLRMENLMTKQHDNYLSNLNTFETISRKYHDLRHILRGIESMESLAEVKSYIHTVEGEILDYELICNTGNKTLDIILSERMRESKDKGIQMHVHADGQCWNNIQDADIATIFGNALDNAIENTEQNDDSSMRLIDVRAGRMNDMLVARFENRFNHPLEKKQMKLLTTKVDKDNHGYGLQSIELTVKKYSGEVDINTEHGLFTLTIIIPFQQMPCLKAERNPISSL
jgi:hypothetical protein